MKLTRLAMGGKMKRMLVGLLLLGLVVNGVACGISGGSSGGSKGAAYNAVHDDLQNAVTGYATDHQGNFPYNVSGTQIFNTDCTASRPCYVINMSAILVANGGMLRQVPDGTRQDNCYGGATGCSDLNHYTWLVNTVGYVYSKCMGSDCNSNDASGYQGVWP